MGALGIIAVPNIITNPKPKVYGIINKNDKEEIWHLLAQFAVGVAAGLVANHIWDKYKKSQNETARGLSPLVVEYENYGRPANPPIYASSTDVNGNFNNGNLERSHAFFPVVKSNDIERVPMFVGSKYTNKVNIPKKVANLRGADMFGIPRAGIDFWEYHNRDSDLARNSFCMIQSIVTLSTTINWLKDYPKPAIYGLQNGILEVDYININQDEGLVNVKVKSSKINWQRAYSIGIA